MLLVSGRVSVPKPLSQIQRSTRWLLQGLSPRTSFGGFGLSLGFGFGAGGGGGKGKNGDNHDGEGSGGGTGGGGGVKPVAVIIISKDGVRVEPIQPPPTGLEKLGAAIGSAMDKRGHKSEKE